MENDVGHVVARDVCMLILPPPGRLRNGVKEKQNGSLICSAACISYMSSPSRRNVHTTSWPCVHENPRSHKRESLGACQDPARKVMFGAPRFEATGWKAWKQGGVRSKGGFKFARWPKSFNRLDALCMLKWRLDFWFSVPSPACLPVVNHGLCKDFESNTRCL